MNFQQLEYIIAVDTYKNFVQAAEKCFVTQPTLSTMIQKLEDELDVKIFDRKKHPVSATDIGKEIIAQAKNIVNLSTQMKYFVKDYKDNVEGEVRIGIIPTVAPYLLPLFLKRVLLAYPGLSLKIEELTTALIIDKLLKGELDMGIMATPSGSGEVKEYPLYNEQFFIYAPAIYNKQWGNDLLLPEDLKVEDLLLLEEGHCFREQFMHICSLKKADIENRAYFEAGSLEMLIHLADEGYGITLLPELAVKYLCDEGKDSLKSFSNPQPVREISIVVHSGFERRKLIEALSGEIKEAVRPFIENKSTEVVPISI